MRAVATSPATRGANHRSSFVACSHAFTHAARAACMYTCQPTVAHATRSRQPFSRTTHQTGIYPLNQPVVQISIAQTAIEFIVDTTGNGGFNVKVGGKTELAGGQITSTDKAEADKKNSFTSAGPITTSDIQNTAAYNASANSITVGVGRDLNKSGAGTGKASGSAASTTQSGITGVAGKKDAKTGDKEVGIQQIFDKDTVKADVDAQVQITKQFGQNASKAVGDLATSKLKEAVGLKEKALEEKDPVKRAEMIKEAQSMEANWGEGGAARVALHTFGAALSGGASAAAGAAAVATAMPVVADQLDKAGVSPEAKQALTQLLAVGIMSNSASAAAAGLNVDSNNRALHEQETKLLKAKSQEFSDKLKERGLDVTPAQAQAILKEQAENRIDMSAAKIPDTATGNDAIKAEAQKFINQLGKEAGTYDDGTGKKTQFFTNKDPQGNVRDKDFYDPKMFADIKKAEDGKFTGTISAGAYAGLGGEFELKFDNGQLTEVKGVLGAGLGGKALVIPRQSLDGIGVGFKYEGDAVKSYGGEIQPGDTRIGFTAGAGARVGPAQANVTVLSVGAANNPHTSNTYGYIDIMKPDVSISPQVFGVGTEAKVGIEVTYRLRVTELPNKQATGK